MSVKCILTNQSQDISVKADKSYVDTQLSLKEDITSFNTSLNLKMDKTEFENQLGTKANASDVNAKDAEQDIAISNAQSKADSADTKATTAQNDAATAQSTASSALTAANNVLPKSGGTMSGQISMSNYKITAGATCTDDLDGANKGYVDNAIPFIWGDENAVGDEQWWLDLRSAILNNRIGTEIIGKKKKVSLSGKLTYAQEVGITSMTCIGVNIDGDKTATFQTTNTLYNASGVFGDSNYWNGSRAQAICVDFGNKCSAKNAIKTVGMKTSENKRNQPDIITYDICFLPSNAQMGIPTSTSSDNEWSVEGKEQPYPYYDSNSKRIKLPGTKDGTGTGPSGATYWTRSRYYYQDRTSFRQQILGGGSSGMDYYSERAGFAPAFVIGQLKN